jgi:hypothetical protein
MSTTLPEVTARRDPPAPPTPRGPPRLSHKRIDVTFIKGPNAPGGGVFAVSGTNTLKLSGLRASALVTKAGGVSQGGLQLRLWGMTLSNMNELTTLGMTITVDRLVLNNQVILEAGDDDAGMSVVHHGTVYNAWTDFTGMPEVAFHVTSNAGLYEAARAVPPTGYAGMVDVSTVLAGIASLAGWGFQNNGVDVKIENTYHPGTAWDQMQQIVEHANINALRDDGAPPTLIIWPKGGTRFGEVPLVSPDTGMIGYPAYTANGIIVTTRYNPAIGYGQRVKVQSDLPQACGIWVVMTLTHTLDAETPNGTWQTRFEAVPLGLGIQVRSSAP